jgi:hypothetical protein
LPDPTDIVYREIQFFMEKAFHFSYLYLAAIFALVAGMGTTSVQFIAQNIKTTPVILICISVLAMDILYLVAASGCLFSVLKRGLFILDIADANQSMKEWEGFRRRMARGGLGKLGWNVDNYFMLAMFATCFAISFIAAYKGIKEAWPTPSNSSQLMFWVLMALSISHIAPLSMLWAVKWIESKCRARLKTAHLELTSM